MHQDLIDRRDLERAVLRIRLAGVALGATLLLLSPRSDQTAAAAALLGYAAELEAARDHVLAAQPDDAEELSLIHI